jgi:pyruvate/2-oxoglutarate dehydrogenase complex dihydrolipoamide acyltransferase (E2) component
VNLIETDQLLTIVQNLTGRKDPFDDATIIVWQQILADLDYTDAVQAVAAHFRESTDYLLPAHIVAGVRALRNARSSANPAGGDPLALPSRFELDDVRDERVRRNVRELMARWSSTTPNPEGDPHAAALARARQERRGKPAALPRPRRDVTAKPVDLAKVTTGPDWSTAEAREREAVAALHKAGRACGKPVCTRDQCKTARAAA